MSDKRFDCGREGGKVAVIEATFLVTHSLCLPFKFCCIFLPFSLEVGFLTCSASIKDWEFVSKKGLFAITFGVTLIVFVTYPEHFLEGKKSVP